MDITKARELAERIRHVSRARRAAEAEQLVLVTELALEYRVEEEALIEYAAGEKMVRVGGEGTPLVSEFLTLELAALLQRSLRSAAIYIAEAINLRWRHPSLWAKVQDLSLPVNRALKAAGKCASLPQHLADEVGLQWCKRQAGLGWEAAFNHLDELVIAAQPHEASLREREAERSRRVTTWQLTDGNVGMTAVLEALDAQFINATCDDLAVILADHGVMGTREELRAKALGLLATPALALRLQQQALQPAMLTPSHDPLTGTTSYVPLPEDAPEPGTLDHLFQQRELWGVDRPRDYESLALTGCVGNVEADAFATAVSGTNGGQGVSPAPAGCLGHVCGTITVPPAKLQPKVKVLVHVNAADLFVHADGDRQGAAWIEHVGSVTLSALRRMLDGKQVSLQPVIDLNAFPAQDAYRPSPRLGEAVRYLFPTECFPHSTRHSTKLDLDHTEAFHPARGPAQTRIGNLAPLSRQPHRAKTAGYWKVHQPEPARLVWTSPLGYRYAVTPNGTRELTELVDLN